jgi:AbrB family looped-hinge helix DNA binding protein
MPTSSFSAKVLPLGRITIPVSTREILGIEPGDLVEVTIEKKIPVKVGDVIS